MLPVCHRLAIVAAAAALSIGCGNDRPCEISSAQPSLPTIDCQQEFDLQAARPLDTSVPGSHTIKTIIDRGDGEAVHLLDTTAYPLHSAFAVDHLGWPQGLPFFTEYFAPQRRFLLGSITYVEEPDIWAYELAPYDTADIEMIVRSMDLLSDATFFGGELHFHPVSEEQIARAAELPSRIRVVTTEQLFEDITYQPLNLTETIGQVRLLTLDELSTGYVSPREIAVLDRVPNDISVVAGVITEEFQTPLSHVNVLSQQRGTPNMALRGARDKLAPLAGKWARLRVGAFDYAIEEATQEEADQWFQDHRPTPVSVSPPDPSVTAIVDVDDLGLGDIPAVGGKAGHFGELRNIASDVTVRDGFAIPVFFYQQFLDQNGFDDEIAAMLADAAFLADADRRRDRLAELQADMLAAPVDAALLSAVQARIEGEFSGARMRFRSSTNAEDLNGFSGAGLYDSKTGEVGNTQDPIDLAIKTVWASLWNFRAFEERAYVSIDHAQVAMAIMVHPSYPDETANGVAITANVFDPVAGGEDAFYINVQLGEVSVVQPPDVGVIADQIIYFFFHNNQPATYLTRSTLLPSGQTVLSRAELFQLGRALDAIRRHFQSIYDPPPGYARTAMDIEFKRVGTGSSATIEIKQARPYPGRGRP